jgi:hypothetical protein
MQHKIRSKTNFVLKVISEYEPGISKMEARMVSTNDIVATVGFRFEGTTTIKWVVRRSLVFGIEWEVEVSKKDLNNVHLKQAIRDEIQCDWWLRNWAGNRIRFERAEREDAYLQRRSAY